MVVHHSDVELAESTNNDVTSTQQSPNQTPDQTINQSNNQTNNQTIQVTKGDMLVKVDESLEKSANSSNEYLRYIDLLYKYWSDAPSINLAINQLTHTIDVPASDLHIPSVGRSFLRNIKQLTCQTPAPTKLTVLNNITASVKPGLTLIIAPPGGGKSMVLKALAGRLSVDQSKIFSNPKQLNGDIWFNGLTKQEHLSIHQTIDKMTAYVSQTDVHMTTYTVRETLQFALDSSVIDPSTINQSNKQTVNQSELNALHARKVDLILDVLGMRECADTIVGNDVLRGISGGQKRRLSVGEFMISNSRAFLLDEVTNGLDAAVARDMFDCFMKWSKATNGTVVAALQQTTPEVFALFDEVLLLKDGSIVFQGTKGDVESFLWQYHGIEVDPDQDLADFLVEWLTDPVSVYGKQEVRCSKHGVPRSVAGFNVITNDQSINQSVNRLVQSVMPQTASMHITSESLVASYQKSPWFAKVLVDINQIKQSRAAASVNQSNNRSINQSNGLLVQASNSAQNASSYTKAQFMQLYSRTFVDTSKLVIRRQFTMLSRDYETIPARMFTAVFTAIIIGLLFLKLDRLDFYSKYGMLCYALLNLAMGNFIELGATFQNRNACIKHMDASMYPASAQMMSVVATWIPVMLVETILFAIPLYFMVGLAEDAGRFFFFLLILFTGNMCYAAIFRTVALLCATVDQAEQVCSPLFDMAILFGGFMVTREKIPDFLIEFYWLTPVSWALRSLAQNEFYDPSYGTAGGESALRVFEVQTDKVWRWMGFIYLVGFVICLIWLCSYLLATKRFELTRGTKRNDETTNVSAPTHSIEMKSGDKNMATARASLPFTPCSLVFKDIHYTVQVKDADDKLVDRKLLNGISGYVKPGQLTALIGSSGAGKTTLMDVVAGRKTMGKIEGTITVNGKQQDIAVYQRINGYCLQQDLHMALCTVRESLLFSAFLRLPASVDQQAREQFVDEVIELLELTNVKDRIVGNEHYISLSPGQLKLVTIGVELVANPSILFLDEPTSSLDARTALVVMRVVKNIAATGRTVLCTIHQPSSEVFYLFDHLLTLKSGGRCVYFGPIGEQGHSIIEYFENDGLVGVDHEKRADAPVRPHGMNPATWILDVIGAGAPSVTDDKDRPTKRLEYDTLYESSELCKSELLELQMVGADDPSHQVHVNLADYEKPVALLFWAVFSRTFITAWRDSQCNYGRIISMMVLGICFGLIFLQIDDTDYAGINSKVNAIFYVIGLGGFSQILFALGALVSQRSVYYRERFSNCYPPWIYSVSIATVDIPYMAASSMALVLPAYFLIGFDYDGVHFFKFYASVLVCSMVLCSIGQWSAAMFSTHQASAQFMGTFLTLYFLFGGSFIHPSEIAEGWYFFFYTNPIPRSLFACTIDQFRCDAENPYTNTVDCPTIEVLNDDETTTLVTTHAYVNSILGVGYDTYSNHIGYMFAMWAFWMVCTALALKYLNHLKV